MTDEEVIVYKPRGRVTFVLGACIGIACLVGAVWVAVAGADLPTRIGGPIAFLFFAAVGVVIMLASTEGIGRRRHPLVRLDPTGIECARGRVHWSDVERVTLINRPDPQGGIGFTFVGFVLRNGASMEPVAAGQYYDHRWQSRSTLNGSTLEIPAAVEEREAILEGARRFCTGGPVPGPGRPTN